MPSVRGPAAVIAARIAAATVTSASHIVASKALSQVYEIGTLALLSYALAGLSVFVLSRRCI